MSSSRYIRTWEAEKGEQPSLNESMEITADGFVSAGPSTSTPEPKPGPTVETMETDQAGKEAEEKKKSPPPSHRGAKGNKSNKKRK